MCSIKEDEIIFETFFNLPLSEETQHNHTLLLNNLKAQQVALAKGKENDPHFQGNRPSTLLLGNTLSPASLGALFSFYENKTMYEGFLLNLNSFDQPGVQLGKEIALSFTHQEHQHDPLLKALHHAYA